MSDVTHRKGPLGEIHSPADAMARRTGVRTSGHDDRLPTTAQLSGKEAQWPYAANQRPNLCSPYKNEMVLKISRFLVKPEKKCDVAIPGRQVDNRNLLARSGTPKGSINIDGTDRTVSAQAHTKSPACPAGSFPLPGHDRENIALGLDLSHEKLERPRGPSMRTRSTPPCHSATISSSEGALTLSSASTAHLFRQSPGP
jgi:hypothetical protein